MNPPNQGPPFGPPAGAPFGPPAAPGGARYVYPGAAPGYAPYAQAPGRGLAIAGGVISIVIAALIFLASMSVVLLAQGAPRHDDEAKLVALVSFGFVALSVLAVIAGALSCAARPGWLLASGIVQSIFTLAFFVTMGFTGAPGAAVTGLLSLVAAIFSFVGIGQAKRWQAYRRGIR